MMGAWSEEIFGNDLSCDVGDQFDELYEEYEDCKTCYKKIVKEYKTELKEFDITELADFWFALAEKFLDNDYMNKEVRENCIKLYQEERIYELWQENNDLLVKRKEVVNELIEKINKFKKIINSEI